MAGIISKNQSARQARSFPSLVPTRKRREAMPLDNAREFHPKSTVAVPEVLAALLDAGACRHVCKPYAVHPVVKERPFLAVREEAVLHYT